MKTLARSVFSAAIGLVIFGLMVVWPSGVLDALKRRMQAGPWAE